MFLSSSHLVYIQQEPRLVHRLWCYHHFPFFLLTSYPNSLRLNIYIKSFFFSFFFKLFASLDIFNNYVTQHTFRRQHTVTVPKKSSEGILASTTNTEISPRKIFFFLFFEGEGVGRHDSERVTCQVFDTTFTKIK